MFSQFIFFILAVIIVSIILTFVMRYMWFFGVVKVCKPSGGNLKICAWKSAFSTAVLMNAIEV